MSAALILAASACMSQAQPYPNYVADQFDTDTTGAYVDQGWGVPAVITWSTDQRHHRHRSKQWGFRIVAMVNYVDEHQSAGHG